MQNSTLKNDQLWFKGAIIYEVSVRAFSDSNADGIGDFRGLTKQLDYLEDLGVTAVWLLPFFPSPLKDDGYDIADYTSINSIYGSLEDFQEFLSAAHNKGIRVIIELILNHTSDQHPWFQRARRAPQGSSERDFYVWSETPEKYQEARIIFQDFETSNWSWDSVAKAYYWHRFYSHQPDLNYENPSVGKAVFDVLDFWLDMGVDGFRLDAIPYLYESEGTNCENLLSTHAFLQKLRAHIDAKFPNRILLAEANQWPEDAAQFYGNGNECHMNFHFPLMPRLFMALRMEDNFPIIDILQQTPTIPENCQWALFLRNHDELTLEMVTDEDRDYMYRVYAQDPAMRLNSGIRRRLAPLLGNDRRQIELLNALLLSLPGTPVIYYGDEIGMGDNVYVGDRNGVRTPMQWSSDRNAGFSRANPQKLYLPVIVDSEYHYEAVNVEAQRLNSNSLWYWMKRLIATRKRFHAFGLGEFEFVRSNNRKVIVYIRTYGDEQILVVANLSRFVQTVQLDLSTFYGLVPVEIFGQAKFPAISASPYFLSLSPYGFYWFSLVRTNILTQPPKPQEELPILFVQNNWENVLHQSELKSTLESILAEYLYTCSWFAGQSRIIQSVNITERIRIEGEVGGFSRPLAISLKVDYVEGESETYLLPLAYADGEQAMHLVLYTPEAVVARLQIQGQEKTGVLFDAVADKNFLCSLLQVIARNQTYKGSTGELIATATDLFPQLSADSCYLETKVLQGEAQHNTYIIYGDRLFLKLFRKLEEGLHPDLEIRRFLCEKGRITHFAAVAGALEYRPTTRADVYPALPMTLGVLQEYIPNTRTGWEYTLDSLRHYFDSMVTQHLEIGTISVPSCSFLDLQSADIPELAQQTMDCFLPNAQLLGKCVAELHIALASDAENPDFVPEPFSSFYQRSIYQYARNLTGKIFLSLRDKTNLLPDETQILAKSVLNYQQDILERYQLVLGQKINAMRTRCHGDFHLGQVLYTGKDFIITHFEGKPTHSLKEQRTKRSPLSDVAGMLLSFYYAIQVGLRNEIEAGMISHVDVSQRLVWNHFWYTWASAAFLNSYLDVASQSTFLPKSKAELQILLDAYLLERTISALGDELDNRSDWVIIPLQLIKHILNC